MGTVAIPHSLQRYFKVLGVKPSAGADEINAAYYSLQYQCRHLLDGGKHLKEVEHAHGMLRSYFKNPGKYRQAGRVKSTRRGPNFKAYCASGIIALLLLALVLQSLPEIRARFVNFEEGEVLFWKQDDALFGTMIAFESSHGFKNGRSLPAYAIKKPEGQVVWVSENTAKVALRK